MSGGEIYNVQFGRYGIIKKKKGTDNQIPQRRKRETDNQVPTDGAENAKESSKTPEKNGDQNK